MKYWCKSRAITLVQICDNPNLDLVNMNAYIKFGESVSFFLKVLSRNEILA